MSLTQKLREVMKALGKVHGFDRVLEKVLEAKSLLVMKREKALCLDKYLIRVRTAAFAPHLNDTITTLVELRYVPGQVPR